MCTVGQFDQQHPHILAHCQKQLAKILGLGAAWQRLDRKPAQLGHTIDKLRHITAKFTVKGLQRYIAILDSVMKQRRDNALFVEMHIQQNISHGYRMGEIGLAGGAHLAVMRLAAEFKRPQQSVGIDRRVVGTHFFNNGISRSDHRPVDHCSAGKTL